MSYDFLPPEHRPGGARDLHDDWPWPLCYIPRIWTAYPVLILPIKIFGNQESVNYFNVPMAGGVLRGSSVFPIGPPGTWQISVMKVQTRFGGIWLPYMAVTLRNGFHFRLGARFSDDPSYFYVEFPSVAIKKLE